MIYVLILVFIILMATTFFSIKTFLYSLNRNEIIYEEQQENEKCCHHERFVCDKDNVCSSILERRCGSLSDTSCTNSLKDCTVLSEKECLHEDNYNVCEFESGTCQNLHDPYKSFEIPCSEYRQMTKYGYKTNELNCDKRFLI